MSKLGLTVIEDKQILGHGIKFVQDNESMSSYGVMRELHFQTKHDLLKDFYSPFSIDMNLSPEF